MDRIELQWQKIRNNTPNMMQIIRKHRPQTYRQWVDILDEYIDYDLIVEQFDLPDEYTTEQMLNFVKHRCIDDTWKGYQAEVEAERIIKDYGYQVRETTIEEERQGIDLIAVKDGKCIRIQIKHGTFLGARDVITKQKRKKLREKCIRNKIYLMVYSCGKFKKINGKYLMKAEEIIDEEGGYHGMA